MAAVALLALPANAMHQATADQQPPTTTGPSGGDAALTDGTTGPLTRVGTWPLGRARAVAVDESRNLVFQSSGGAVLILDITDPASPVLLSDTLRTGGDVQDIFSDASAQRLYIAAGWAGLEIWDVGDPAAPERLSALPIQYYGTDVSAQAVSVRGDYAYVSTTVSGVHWFDVSDPANPFQSGYYAFGGTCNDLDIQGNTLVAAQSSKLNQFVIQPDGSLYLLKYTDLYVEAVTISGPYAYICSNGYLEVVDLTQIVLVLLGYYDTGNARDVLVDGTVAYVADPFAGLIALDVSNPAGITPVGTAPETTPVKLARAQDILYASGGDLAVVDVGTPSAPAVIGSYDIVGSTYGAQVQGDYAYLAHMQDGLYILDISNPKLPVLVGVADTPDTAIDVFVRGDYAYVADRYEGLRIIDISSPLHPVEVGSLDNTAYARKVAVQGNYAYIADLQFGLRIVQISDPMNPVAAGSLALPGSFAQDVAVSGSYAYVADYDAGLQVVDVSHPSTPYIAGSYGVAGSAKGVAVQGEFAYVTTSDGQLLVLDIGNPANPTLAGSFSDVSFYPSEVCVDGDFAYVTEGLVDDSSLFLFDVSDPANPLELDHCRTPGNALNVFANAGKAYVSDGQTGLQIFGNQLAPVVTVSADLSCSPASGTVPFTTLMTATLTNNYTEQTRRFAARINVVLAGGMSFPSWRAGFTGVMAGGSFQTSWGTAIPALGPVIGDNVFTLVAEDVTPPPYNQPPYPPAADTDSSDCTVTGVAP